MIEESLIVKLLCSVFSSSIYSRNNKPTFNITLFKVDTVIILPLKRVDFSCLYLKFVNYFFVTIYNLVLRARRVLVILSSN